MRNLAVDKRKGSLPLKSSTYRERHLVVQTRLLFN